MMFEGLKKTVDQNFLFSRVLLSEFMCSQWFFTRTGINSCFIGFLMPSNVQDLILVIESGGDRECFMESAGVRYLRTSCWRIRNRTSERSERVRFLIQKQRVRKYRTKHFPSGIVFIIYRQKAQQKLTSRSVYPFPLLFRRLFTVFFIDSETNETIPLHFRMFFTFLARKTLWVKLSRWMCAKRRCKLQ